MNKSFFRTAQGEIAEQMIQKPALAAGMNARKVGLIVAASIIAAMALGSSQEARAGDAISPYAATQEAMSPEQQRQVVQAANKRAREAQQAAQQQRQLEQQARQRAEQDKQQSGQTLGSLLGNGVRSAMSAVVKDGNTANTAGNVAENIARTSTSGRGFSTPVIVSASAGLAGVAGALLTKDPKNRTRNGALAGALGGMAGYILAPSDEPQPDPAAQARQQPQRVVDSPINMPTQPAQRQLVVYDPASIGMPTVIVKVARDLGVGMVAPGRRPYDANDPMIVGLTRAGEGVETALSLRARAQTELDNSRININVSQQAQGQAQRDMEMADRRLAQSTITWIGLRNHAAAVGGFDVTQSDQAVVGDFARFYRADAKQSYSVNAVRTGYSVNASRP